MPAATFPHFLHTFLFVTPRARMVGRLSTLVAVGLLLVGTGALIPLADAHHDLSFVVGGVAAATIVSVLFVVPVALLPGITLLVTLLVPSESTLLPSVLADAAFGVVPLAVWMIRAPASTRTPALLRTLALLFGVWLILSEAFAPLHTNRGWQWLITAGIAVVFSVLATPAGLKPRNLRALFLAITTVLGAYALIEGAVLHQNVLFGTLLEHTTWWRPIQHGVSYRVTTLLGHPLINGTIFSAAAVLAASDLLEKRHRGAFAFARLAILTGAVLATHSRGAAIALAAGILVVIVLSPSRREGLTDRRLVLIVSSIIGAAFILSGLQTRNQSSEGRSSTADRVVVLTRAAQTLHGIEPFGAGPGESDAYRTVMQLPGSEGSLENSYAQLAVSLGPIGALLALLVLVTVVIFGIRSGVIGEAAALLTLLVDIAGYNAIEGDPPILILIALFVISIITGATLSVARHVPGAPLLSPASEPT